MIWSYSRIALLVSCAFAAVEAPAQGTRLLTSPAIGRTHIAFVYARELWIAGLDGTNPRQLTSIGGVESSPVFSPDGKSIAFSAQYDGNVDVYVIPAEGGEPKRLTWHPGMDVVQSFTPDGTGVLFTSGRESFTYGDSKLFVARMDGSYPEALGLPFVNKAAYSPDGKRIVYNPLHQAFNSWKNYRGGTASVLWIFNTADRQIEKIPQPKERSNDTDPMWIGDVIYFRSDRDGEFNLYSFDTKSKSIKRLTNHSDFPIVEASMGGGKIIYEQAGYLHVFDPASAKSRQIAVTVNSDLPFARPHYVKGAQYIRHSAVSPTGSRAAFEFRGEIVTVPGEKGDARNITSNPAANDRVPAWSPDGKSIAYFSDVSGEYQLYIANQDGTGAPRPLKLTGAGIYEELAWSPDSKKIAYVDIGQTVYVMDVQSGAIKKVGQDPIMEGRNNREPVWSPDSKWIAYVVTNQAYIRRAYVYSVDQDKSFPVSDGLSDVVTPVFDKSGKYMYLLASTDAGPVRQWFMQSNADPRSRYSIYLVTLRKDIPSPLARESDEEKGPAAEPATPPKPADAQTVEPIRIDFDGLLQRTIDLPLPPANYTSLQAGPAGEIYFLRMNEYSGSVERFTLAKRTSEVMIPSASSYTLTADTKKILYASGSSYSGGGWYIVASGKKVDPAEGKINTDGIEVRVDPRAEWPQIYNEAWRINRDLFYATNYHGADWPAIREKYKIFLPHLTSRGDLSRVLKWMVSELATGHHGAYGDGDLPQRRSVPGGLLGADYAIENNRYRFKRVYGGLNWTPNLRAPLTEPGVNVKAGDYLLAVNGKDLRSTTNIYSMFENTAGKITQITVGPNADGTGSRTASVVPLASENELRNRAWVERNQQIVDSATNGRVAYVYVPNTGSDGHDYFKRYFYPQADRDAIIVDERFNGGGLIADYYIDMLRRPYISHWAMRYGDDLKTPTASIQGPKVLIVDEEAGSGGDLFPWMWRKFGLGPIVGKATWGGLVGHWGGSSLMDGGVSSPNLAIWTNEGFIVENVGVPPDIEVDQTPALMMAGHDPQLEKAIEVILQELKKNPPPTYKRPPFPVRVKKGS